MKYFKLAAGSLLVLFAVLNGSRVLTSTQDIAYPIVFLIEKTK